MSNSDPQNIWDEGRQKQHEARLSWFKSISPLLMVIVTALAAYWGVDRHTQSVRDAELDLEEYKVTSQIKRDAIITDENIRSQYLTKSIESPDNIIRLKYLRYLKYPRDETGFSDWATAELEIVQVSVEEAEKTAQEAVTRANKALEKLKKAEQNRIIAETAAKKSKEELDKALNENDRLLAESKAKEAKETLQLAENTVELAKVDVEIAHSTSQMSPNLGLTDYAASLVKPKNTLYNETISVLETLLLDRNEISETSSFYQRFWELYKVDLIGVESGSFARIMVQIGGSLKKLLADKDYPIGELERLVDSLKYQAYLEVRNAAFSRFLAY